jgi:hypothetical protein
VTSIGYLNVLKKNHGQDNSKRNLKKKVEGEGGQVIEKNNKFRDCNILCIPKSC